MKNAKLLYIVLLMAFTALTATAQKNEIILPDQRFWAEEILVPIQIENTDDVVAMQFDLQVPSGISVYARELDASRKADHEFTVNYLRQEQQHYYYRVMLYSPTNTPLKEHSGTVATMRLTRYGTIEGTYHDMVVSNAVLSNSDGQNVLTGTQNGILDFTDLPQLKVTASKSVITEGEDMELTVSIDHDISEPLTITLQSENDARFDYNMQTLMPAGQRSVTIPVRTVNDELPSLNLSNTFTASAPDHHNGEVLVVLKDDDVPELSLTFDVSEVNELDGDGAVTATLRRTRKTNNKITVKISDDAGGGLTYAQHTIEMAKDVDEVKFHLGPVDNDNIDGDRTYHVTAAIFVASCDCAVGGESAGSVTATLRVLDDDGPNGHTPNRQLADAIVSNLTVNQAEVEVGGNVTFTITVKNQGTDVLAATNIDLYNETTGENVATLRTRGAMAVGDTETLTRKVYLTHVGTQQFYAVVNETEEVSELRYTNNRSSLATVKVTPPFTASITTDRHVYVQKDTVVITGRLTGHDIARASVDIYFINEGCREVTTVVSNAQGEFYFKWAPYEYQSGHFILGACYPGEELTTAMAEVDIYGLRRADRSRISNEITIGEAMRGNIMLDNPGLLPLTGVKAEVVSIPDNCVAEVNLPASIAANSSVPLQFSLLASTPSPQKQWQQAKVVITSAEGVRLPLTLYYYAQYAQACLVAVDGNDIYTSMTNGQVREYPLVITNTGKGSSGQMTLVLPPCIKSPTGNTLSALEPGDTTIVQLNFVPVEAMQLNVPYTGMFSITPEHGIGLAMNFSVMPVSDQTGTLVVDVTDELTYYTEEAPHVAGAQVVLRNAVTEAVMAQGLTDENGLYTVTLPEGYYQLNVTSDKHSSFKNNILINPGMTNMKEVCLTYQAVTVTWEVVETEVEDEYKIVSTMDFEARVPVPVVQLNTVPERLGIDHLAPGESLIFHNLMTNKGLIAAWNTNLYLPADDEYFTWEPLAEYEGLLLEPQQSYVIPVRVTRVGGSAESRRNAPDGGATGMPCGITEDLSFEWPCGGTFHTGGASASLYTSGQSCGGGRSGGWIPEGPGDGGPGWGWIEGGVPIEEWAASDCNDCLDDLLSIFRDCVLPTVTSGVPLLGCAIGMGSCLNDVGHVIDGDKPLDINVVLPCMLSVGGCAVEVLCPECSVLGGLLSLAGCLWTVTHLECTGGVGGSSGSGGFGGPGGVGPGGSGSDGSGSGSGGDGGDDGQGGSKAPKKADILPSYAQSYQQKCQMMLDVINAFKNQYDEFFGDTIWMASLSQQQFGNLISTVASTPTDQQLTAASIAQYVPEGISSQQVQHFVDRFNNSRLYAQTGQPYDNMIDMENMQRQIEVMRDAEFTAIGLGYESFEEMFQKETEDFMARASETSEGVCATIKLQITQTMTLTRQGFHGTLTIQNGSEHADMQDIKLRLKVVSENGVTATSREFEMHVESLDGFTGEADFDSGWGLEANQKGTADILFIPTKYAAPVKPVNYSFGGTLSYVDANTGLRVTRELYPVTLTVKPTPELDLTYFMQRDIWGDDPLTEDVVEPMVPAEFTVVINNKGYGDATNVRMMTEQPKIIENEKHLYIDFEILASTLRGQDRVLAMGKTVPTEFGTIPAHSQTWGSWELQSTLLGHFVTYNIEATHVTSYGNPDLSLLDQVTIHELIHGFTPEDGQQPDNMQRAFLVNDVLDADDTPDALYFSDATQTEVYLSAQATTAADGELTYKLHVVPSREGWNYGSVEDPTDGRQRLLSIMRLSDQQELPLDNFWQTDRTLRDAKAPVYENLLHFVGQMSAQGEDYLLTFERRPDVELAVESYLDLPNEDSVITYSLPSLTVRFTKPIDFTTFNYEDIKLCHQGVPLDISRMPITRINDTDYRLTLTGLTDSTGYYVLTVQTAKITDNEGFLGTTGKMATWIQLLTQGIYSPLLDGTPMQPAFPARRYDLQGRPVGPAYRGLRIVGGRVILPGQ
ncbi:MAG: hypothetical protein IJT98_05910 [Prevotella sp.]|nr:hypothetical protein [Prevotella sp.]